MVREGLTARRLGEELAIDAVRYRAHPEATVLVCFVHDPGNRIENPRGIEDDLVALSDDDLQIVAVIAYAPSLWPSPTPGERYQTGTSAAPRPSRAVTAPIPQPDHLQVHSRRS